MNFEDFMRQQDQFRSDDLKQLIWHLRQLKLISAKELQEVESIPFPQQAAKTIALRLLGHCLALNSKLAQEPDPMARVLLLSHQMCIISTLCILGIGMTHETYRLLDATYEQRITE